MADWRRVRPAPFLLGQRPAGRALVVHVRWIFRIWLAQGSVLHRRVRGRRQQGRKIHEKSRLHGSRARKGECSFKVFNIFLDVYVINYNSISL